MPTDQDLRPWYRGLILWGDLAKQYSIEFSDPETAPPADITLEQQELWLNGLAPITIFVGANNSGKSRLLRGIFSDYNLVDWLRLKQNSNNSNLAPITNILRNAAQESIAN
ncbi:hypothetical protein NZK32_08985 [Cyanobium sp. FGCU-52]|nr:hypothetical protein [Cyanobium sp. FGCU52]